MRHDVPSYLSSRTHRRVLLIPRPMADVARWLMLID